MGWTKELSARGIDPAVVKDATEVYLFEIPADPKFLKGCEIGNPTKCSASKALNQEPDVVWAFIGASVAIVEFKNGDILRYYHNGVIPKTQDNLVMPPPGIYRLVPPNPSKRLGKGRPQKGKGEKIPNPKAGNRRKMVYSTAGQLRR